MTIAFTTVVVLFLCVTCSCAAFLYADVMSEVYKLTRSSEHKVVLYKGTNNEERGALDMYAVEVSSKTASSCTAVMMVVCGQHAREVITVHVCLRFLEKLVEGHSVHSDLVRRGLVSVLVVVSANPRGMDIALTVNPCLRRNPRGVDLNRNWPRISNMEVKMSNEENPGKVPLSEFETRFVESLLHNATGRPFRPDVLVNVHTGERMILYPYDGSTAEVPLKFTHHAVAGMVRDKFCPECKVGSGREMLYPSVGTLCDWAVARAGVSLAYTWEIFMNETDSTPGMRGCHNKYNPDTTSAAATRVIENWSEALLYTMELTEKLCHAQESVIPRFSGGVCAGKNREK